MKDCPGFEKSAAPPATSGRDDLPCKTCKHFLDPYCKPVGNPMFFEDRTPVEDRLPPDITDTHDPRYEG